MTDQDQINVNLQRQIDAQSARIDNVMAKVDLMILEAQQQREDIRRLQDRQDAAQAKHDAEMKEMNARFDAKFDKISDQIHTMTIMSVVGFGAIAAAIGGLIITALKP